MNSIARLLSVTFAGALSIAPSIAQPADSQFPTPSASPLATPPSLPTPSPTPFPTPLPDGTMPLPLPAMPTPVPLYTLPPATYPLPAASPIAAPTPLPDGTMPLPVPAMPSPTPENENVINQDLNLANPLPAPDQFHEKLGGPGSKTEAEQLKESQDLAMKQKMVMADFEKSVATLIAQQRNPKVADMTLDDAVRIALKQNPDILNAIQQIRLTRGQLIQVVSTAIPHLGVSTGYTQQASELVRGTNQQQSATSVITLPNPNGGSPLVGTIESQSNNNDPQNQSWSIQFQATQLIFDGGATIAGIQAGSAALNSAYFTLRYTIDNIISQVVTAFYQVVLNRALIVAQQQNVTLNEQQVKDQQNRYDAGTVPRFNVLQAEVALANAKPPLIQAQNNYRISMYQLVRLLGMDYPPGQPSEVPFNIVGTLGYSPKTINTDVSIRVAIARNPSLKAQRENILAQASNVTANIAGWFPTINANAGYQYQNDPRSANLTDTVEGWFFGATGQWNVWDGGLTYGKVAQAKAQMMQAKNTYDNSVRQIVLDVQTAISNLKEAKETIDSQTASVVQATEAVRLAKERLDAGAGTQLDVLNAQTQLLQSQSNVLQARYNYLAALASYDFALSLDTQYVELFDDPLVRPFNPQALNSGERRTFRKSTNPDKPQPPLPRVYKKSDPTAPILQVNPGSKTGPAITKTPKSKKKTAVP